MIGIIFGPACEIEDLRKKLKLDKIFSDTFFKIVYYFWLPFVYFGLVIMSVVDFEYPETSIEFIVFVGLLIVLSLIPVLTNKFNP